MPRRAKRIIAVIFFVLLAVPVAYLVLSWRPAAPLEFQAIGYRANSDIQPPGHMDSLGSIEVLIVNKSAFPIAFYWGYLERNGDATSSPVLLQHSGADTGRYITIPPGKFIRAKSGDWDPRDLRDGGIHTPGIKVRYYWLSMSRAYVDDWFAWWHNKRDPNLFRFPEFHEGLAPLVPPPDSATVEP